MGKVYTLQEFNRLRSKVLHEAQEEEVVVTKHGVGYVRIVAYGQGEVVTKNFPADFEKVPEMEHYEEVIEEAQVVSVEECGVIE